MRFRLVEDLLLEGPRGQTELRDFICELLNRICRTTLNCDDYELHHKDFCHSNNDPRNLVLLPKGTVLSSTTPSKNFKKPNSSVHKKVGSLDVFDKKSVGKYKNNIGTYAAVDVYRSLRKGSIVYLDARLLQRDMNVAKKNPMGMIR